uniref:MAGE domain-containing protein n=1 Tax=Ascaris lumbricoides TaxID=6252 RepID=A0A0M3HYP4_ASCLU
MTCTEMDSSADLESMDQTETVELNSEERSILTEAANFFLFAQQRKGMVREADMKKIFARARSKVTQEEIYYRLKEYLKKVLGYEVIAVSNKRGTWLVAKNLLAHDEQNDNVSSNYLSTKEKMKEGFLNALLVFLYMAKNPASTTQVSESDLWKFITPPFIDTDEQQVRLQKNLRHTLPADLVDLKRLVGATPQAEFVWQGWIEYEKVPDANGTETIYYSWGPRAKCTVDRMVCAFQRAKILKFFCAISGDNPRQWKYHCKDANESSETAMKDNIISEQEQGPSHS